MKYLLVALLLIHAPLLQAAPGGSPVVPAPLSAPERPQDSSRLLDRTNLLVTLGFGSACLVTRSHRNNSAIVQSLEDAPLGTGFKIGNAYGRGDTMGIIVLGFWGLGKARDDARMAATGQDLSKSLLAAWTATWVLKITVDAERPNGQAHSFPSGHTSTAFAAAPVFYRHYGKWAGVPAYTLATLTALARVECQKHYPADVLAGAAIGIIAGRTFAKAIPIRILPAPGGPVIGLSHGF